MKTSKSPNDVAQLAYITAQRCVPAYRHEFSPKKFTQDQLVACLVLKEFFRTDYRGLAEILKDSSDLKRILELETIPHFTTFQKAAHAILQKQTIKKLIKEIVRVAIELKIMKEKTARSAIDSTGLESGHTSRYFIKRRERGEKNLYQATSYKRFPKLALACDTTTHIITGALSLRGPSPDIVHFKKLIKEMLSINTPTVLLADAGYDSEESHRFIREKLHMHIIIPPLIGRKTGKLPTGPYRREMATKFDRKTYGQRWQAETVNSMIKRNLGEELSTKSYWSQCREIMLKVFAHNVMVVRWA